MEDPARAGAWGHSDAVLNAQGSASKVVATLLSDLGLTSAGDRILDVGSGVAGLAVAFCELVPHATVVGVDPWPPALELARANVAAAALEKRVTLVESTIQDFDDPEKSTSHGSRRSSSPRRSSTTRCDAFTTC